MSTNVSQYLRQNTGELADLIITRQYELQPELLKPPGDLLRQKSQRDIGYHLTYLAEALDAGDPLLFSEYLAWVKVLFANLNFPDHIMPATLDCTRQVLHENLPAESRQAALDMLDAGASSMALVPTSLPSFISGDQPLDDLARQYLQALLNGERHTASQMILAAAGKSAGIKEIYVQVFQRTQREIGRLWQTNQISVAQEHYCTAATQLIMSQLYPMIFTGKRTGRRLVATCVGGELHEIGARMVADFFEMDGWDTYFLGANTPPDSIVHTVEERQADIVAISATMTFHINKVTEIINALRASPTAAATRILVGGYTFNLAPELWQRIGADGYAPDANTAITEAERVLRI